MTLDELKTLVQNYTQNDETVFVSTINDFIKNAEERLLELVQINVFRKTSTGTSTPIVVSSEPNAGSTL